jgi:hypothetical protein
MRRSILALGLALGFVVALAVPALAEPPTEERPHEILSDRPSGFWTSNRPAVGGAYKWRLLEVGTAVALLTGLLTYRLVKHAKAPPRVQARLNPSPRRTTP